MTRQHINQTVTAFMAVLMFIGTAKPTMVPVHVSEWAVFAAGIVGLVSSAYGFNVPPQKPKATNLPPPPEG